MIRGAFEGLATMPGLLFISNPLVPTRCGPNARAGRFGNHAPKVAYQ
jgi:hypothetical protein